VANDTKSETTSVWIDAVAHKHCELKGIDPQARTPDGPFIICAREHMKSAIDAIRASGYSIVHLRPLEDVFDIKT